MGIVKIDKALRVFFLLHERGCTMDIKSVTTRQYAFLKSALTHWVSNQQLSQEKADELISSYEPSKAFNFIRVLTAIGSLLLGFGVLSFIASNWEYMARPLKLFVIIGFLVAFNLAGYFLKENYPKTSSALLYVGALIYGAGIFLIEQMFHLSSAEQYSFFIWATGLIPLMLLTRDRVISAFTLVLYMIWLVTSTFEFNQFPWYGFLVCLPYYALWLRHKEQGILFLANTFGLFWLFFGALDLDLQGLWIALIFFALGLFQVYQKQITPYIHGNILLGVAGLSLTSPVLWDLSERGIEYSIPAIGFAILFGLYLLRRIHKGSLFSIVLVCALIVRYYVDLTYDFLPKSIFFIIGGLILLGFGYSFERKRRKGGLNNEQ